jgi:hypothetical protein
MLYSITYIPTYKTYTVHNYCYVAPESYWFFLLEFLH